MSRPGPRGARRLKLELSEGPAPPASLRLSRLGTRRRRLNLANLKSDSSLALAIISIRAPEPEHWH
eukprot:2980539-Rhodomonas_salina.1